MKGNVFNFDHVIKLRDFIIDLLFPVECLSCGRSGEWLCRACYHKIKINETEQCLCCGQKSEFGKFCRKAKDEFSLDGIISASLYADDLAMRMIKTLKYNFVRELSGPISTVMAARYRDLAGIYDIRRESKPRIAIFSGKESTLLMPIPLHPRREKFRGFNQSALIAGGLADSLGLAFVSGELIRVKHSQEQAKMEREKRKENIKGSFQWIGARLGGVNIILVDDVATTGATLNEAAKVLKENGAGEVWGLVMARG